MSFENFSPKNVPTAEKKESNVPKIIKSLALAATLTGGVIADAEAGQRRDYSATYSAGVRAKAEFQMGSTRSHNSHHHVAPRQVSAPDYGRHEKLPGPGNSIEITYAPELTRITAELAQHNLHPKFQSFGNAVTMIYTEEGKISLSMLSERRSGPTPTEQLNSKLTNISGQQIRNETVRQNIVARPIRETIRSGATTILIEITPYAQAFFAENNITYTQGTITKGDTKIELFGNATRDEQCNIHGSGEFKSYVIAECKDASSRPNSRSGITSYKVNNDMSVTQLAGPAQHNASKEKIR